MTWYTTFDHQCISYLGRTWQYPHICQRKRKILWKKQHKNYNNRNQSEKVKQKVYKLSGLISILHAGPKYTKLFW